MKRKITMRKWKKIVFSTFFYSVGGFLICYSYYMWIGYYEAYNLSMEYYFLTMSEPPWVFDPLYQWRFVYFAAGFTAIASGLIITYRTLSTLTSHKANGTLSAILTTTGSFLVYSAYTILVEHHQTQDRHRRSTHIYSSLPPTFQRP